jgi:hypothetical protein
MVCDINLNAMHNKVQLQTRFKADHSLRVHSADSMLLALLVKLRCDFIQTLVVS